MGRTKQTARKTNLGPMKTLTKPTKHPPASGGVVAAQAPAARRRRLAADDWLEAHLMAAKALVKELEQHLAAVQSHPRDA